MQRKTNIFYLITELDVGGAENMLFELASRVDRRRYNVTVCCLTGRGAVGGRLSARGVAVEYLEMKNKLDLGAFFRLASLLKKHRADILHTFLFHANFAGRIAGRMAGVRLIVSSVRVSEKQKISHILGERLTWRLADAIVCVSRQVKEFMAEKARIPPRRMRVIPNGIDPEYFCFRADSARMKKALGIPPGARVAGTVSRLSRQKRVDRFVECARRVLGVVPDVFFVAAGQGELEGELKALAGRLGVSERVRFLGFREDVLDVMSVFDVFMLTSSWEGMPVSLLEAMALGKPCVVSAVEGSSEVVVHGATGFLVPPEDAEGFAGCVIRVLEDAPLAAAMGERARERAGMYSVENMVRMNESLYDELSAGAV